MTTRPPHLLHALLFASVAALTACSESREDDGVAGLLAGFEAEPGEAACPFPCVLGTECIDGVCTVPCEVPCAAGEVCAFGACVPEDELRGVCDPPCASHRACVEGACVVPNGCFPACEAGLVCDANAACVPADACANDRRCGGDPCVGGVCVDPIDPATWRPSSRTSYVWDIDLPRAVEGCCLDVSGDGVPDNNLAFASDAFSALGLVDLRDGWNAAVESGEAALVFDFDDLAAADAAIDLGVVRVNLDRDGDGAPDLDWTARAQGGGTYALDPRSVSERGPESRFPAARVARGTLASGPSVLTLPVPGGTFLSPSGAPTQLRLQAARVEGALAIGGTGVRHREVPTGPLTQSSVWVGGALPAADWARGLNEFADACGCVRAVDGDLFGVDIVDDVVEVACDPDATLDRCNRRDDACAALEPMCEALPLLSLVDPWDVDLDRDGVGDAMSVGLRLRLSPATVVR